MHPDSNILPSALWPTGDADTTHPTSWARATFGGLLIEAVLLGILGGMAMAQKTPVALDVPMRVEMVKPEPPKPPAPVEEMVKQKPVVQKTIPRKIVMTQPKHINPQPVPDVAPPTPEPMIAPAERPSPEAAAVATPAAAPAPVRTPSPPVAMTLACPVQVPPEMPPKALAAGIEGRVVARAKIKSGKVINVDIIKSTPPGIFDAAVRSAMMRYQCENNSDDVVVADQTFNFILN
ncbi:energy transducer TonB [Cupriavidus sp. 8B]